MIQALPVLLLAISTTVPIVSDAPSANVAYDGYPAIAEYSAASPSPRPSTLKFRNVQGSVTYPLVKPGQTALGAFTNYYLPADKDASINYIKGTSTVTYRTCHKSHGKHTILQDKGIKVSITLIPNGSTQGNC